jgi:hypothetical protein
MVILLIFEVVMKAHHAWLGLTVRYPMMDEAKHRGIGFCDARP